MTLNRTTLILLNVILAIYGVAAFAANPTYIQLGTNWVSYDFTTGVSTYPINYNLYTKNIGPQPARFDISSDTSWVFVYREGQTGNTSVQVANESALNFVIEIRAEQAKDGISQALVAVNAVNLQDSTVMDTQTVTVTLSKNVSSPSPSPVPSSSPTPSVSVSPALTPRPTATSQPSPTKIISPAVTSSPPKSPLPKTAATPRVTKIPNQSPAPSATIGQDSTSSAGQGPGVLVRLWRFLIRLFFR